MGNKIEVVGVSKVFRRGGKEIVAMQETNLFIEEGRFASITFLQDMLESRQGAVGSYISPLNWSSALYISDVWQKCSERIDYRLKPRRGAEHHLPFASAAVHRVLLSMSARVRHAFHDQSYSASAEKSNQLPQNVIGTSFDDVAAALVDSSKTGLYHLVRGR